MYILLTWNHPARSLSHRYNHAITQGLCVWGISCCTRTGDKWLPSLINHGALEYTLNLSMYGVCVCVDAPIHMYTQRLLHMYAYVHVNIYHFWNNLLENIYNAGVHISRLHVKEDSGSRPKLWEYASKIRFQRENRTLFTYIFDNENPCDEKTALLSCCLSISQHENPAHSCFWTFRQRPKLRISTTSFCLAFLGQLVKWPLRAEPVKKLVTATPTSL